MPPRSPDIYFGDWIREWNNIANIVAWMSGIVGSAVTTPSVASSDTQSLTTLSRFIAVAAVAALLFFTNKLKRYRHAKVWMRCALVALVLLLGGWFFNNYWVCTLSNGKKVVMGYTRTRNGDYQRGRTECETNCEALIQLCGQHHAEFIWTAASIHWAQTMLVLNYFVGFAVGILFITSIIQTMICLKKPDSRLEIDGTWECERSDGTVVMLSLAAQPDLKGVTGTLSIKQLAVSFDLYQAAIGESHFSRGYLCFSTTGQLARKYAMTIDSLLGGTSTLRDVGQNKLVGTLRRHQSVESQSEHVDSNV